MEVLAQRLYPIYVPTIDIDENSMEHYEVIDWCVANLSDSSTNALYLSIEDIYLLYYKSEVLDIINEENDSMLAEGENDWIISQDVKRKVYLWLMEVKKEVTGRILTLVEGILKLLEVSITTNRNIYFVF